MTVGATVQVSELYTDASGNTTVKWSKNNQGGGYSPNSSYTLPSQIKINSSYVIVGQVIYSYKPAVAYKIVGPLTSSIPSGVVTAGPNGRSRSYSG